MRLCNRSGSYWKNPQFKLSLTAADVEAEDDDDEEEDEDEKADSGTVLSPAAQKQKEKGKKCTLLVELLQRDRRSKKQVKFLYVAFHIYKVREKRRGGER